MGGGSIEGKNENTSVSCWSSKQMCFHAEYAKHIQGDMVILACYPTEVYWQNKQKSALAAETKLKLENDW